MTRKHLIWVAVGLLAITAYPIATHYAGTFWFTWKTEHRAGQNALDCGHAVVGPDPSATVRCVNESLNLRRPFHAIFEHKGIDSSVATGVARSRDGSITLLRYDSNPGGICLVLCFAQITEQKCTRASVEASKLAPVVPFWSVKLRCDEPGA